jgi:excisionase family DNA binding protein
MGGRAYNMQKFLTKVEAAKAIGVCSKTLERYLMEGRLKGARLKKGWCISESNLEEFIKNEEEATQAALKGKGDRPKPGFNGTRNKAVIGATGKAAVKKAAATVGGKVTKKNVAKKSSVKKTAVGA